MKVARTTEKDINILFDLLNALDAIKSGHMPEENEDCLIKQISKYSLEESFDKDVEEYVSYECNYFIRQALKHLLNIYESGYLMLAAMNLTAFLNPENEIVDMNDSTLELHPKIKQGLEDTERLDWIIKNGARIENDGGEIAFCAAIEDTDMARGPIGIRDEISYMMQERCSTMNRPKKYCGCPDCGS